jgi:starvation-inducible DNA-binding protein
MPRTIFYGRINDMKVTFQPNIGLDVNTRQSVVKILNILLADEAVLSLKTRQADEQLGATHVSSLHPIYTAQQTQISDIVTEIAERISILGGTYLTGSEVTRDSTRLDGKPGIDSDVMNVLADHEAFIRFLREDAQKCSEIYEDQGSFALFVNILRQHEKMAWMLRAYIEPKFIDDENQGS